MRVLSIEIENYKTFYKRQRIELDAGFNLLIGANNSGKTSVLDVVDLEPSMNQPHRSRLSIPNYGGMPTGSTKAEVSIQTTIEELRLLSGGVIHLPIDDSATREGPLIEAATRGLVAENAPVLIRTRFGASHQETFIEAEPIVRGNFVPEESRSTLVATVDFRPVNGAVYGVSQMDARGPISAYPNRLRERVYRFNAQRRPASISGVAPTQLDRDAQNLPFCLNYLQTNDSAGHRQFCSWVKRIFPNISWVQAPPVNNQFEVRCLPEPPESRREDLATPMSLMGSGVGNVLAMLYVVLTSRYPQLIAIDEPNAFLHPRAIRELLSILGTEGAQHQYLLTGHSADVITGVDAQTVSLLQFDGAVTSVNQTKRKELPILRLGLSELGIRMTDLHAKDSVLWVEGQTEELVLPPLLRYACVEVASGVAVLRVERTGSFNAKRGMTPYEVAAVYERLSRSSALVPPMVCVLLDGEDVPPSTRKQRELDSNGNLRYLPRRMLESYLIHSGAIAAILQSLGEDVNNPAVQERIFKVCESAYDAPEVDAAKLLNELIQDLTDARQEFRKTRDVPTAVAWLLANAPEHLAPLRQFLRQLFGLQLDAA